MGDIQGEGERRSGLYRDRGTDGWHGLLRASRVWLHVGRRLVGARQRLELLTTQEVRQDWR